ncbi:TPA: SIS domain-containing protein [Klebsiella pneumoniae]
MSKQEVLPAIAASCWTEEEIRQQPAVWRETVNILEAMRAQIDAFIDPLLKQPDLRIILTGAGSSAFAGDTLAPKLARMLSVPVSAVSTTDIVSDPLSYLPRNCPLLLVSFARSGSSPESLAALKLAEQRNAHCYHLLITCNPQGELHQHYHQQANVLSLPLPAKTCDRGFAMTSSMTSMMLACLTVFNAMESTPTQVEQLADSVSHQFEAQQDLTRSPLQRPDIQRVIWLGSGMLQGIAHESALKLLELTAGKISASYESPLGFRHGPKSLVNPHTQVLLMVSNDPSIRRYDLDLLAELRNDNVAASVVALAGRADNEIEQGEHYYLPDAGELDDSLLALGFLSVAQVYALAASLAFGISPDNPSPEGRVNRVVQGVIIHPWQPIVDKEEA